MAQRSGATSPLPALAVCCPPCLDCSAQRCGRSSAYLSAYHPANRCRRLPMSRHRRPLERSSLSSTHDISQKPKVKPPAVPRAYPSISGAPFALPAAGFRSVSRRRTDHRASYAARRPSCHCCTPKHLLTDRPGLASSDRSLRRHSQMFERQSAPKAPRDRRRCSGASQPR